MIPVETTDWISKKRLTALLRSTCAIALATAVALSLGASSLLYAVHVKSEVGEKNLPAQKEKMGKLGEVDRGPTRQE